CGRDVSTLAPSCPHCGRPSPAATAPILPASGPPQPKEETVWRGSPSWTLLIGRLIALIICAIGIPLLFYALASAGNDPGLATLGWVITIPAVLILGISFVMGLVVLRSTQYTITNQRILVEKGLFSKHVDEVDMRLIDDSQFSQSFLHRILGIGNVTVMSSDKNTPVFTLRGIGDPRSVREMVRTHSYQASQRQVFTRPT
ncbi:MAG TPA: PH domain-containing protein, partial [Thermoanaerobaculia bacterium]|nr:PH domain-containing protein [Thermoanaerobaculia bacterium]